MSDKKIKLLIVDDEVKFLDSIARRLELRDFDVTKATRGEEAVEISRHQKFDLALLDLKMPGMDGKQDLEVIKREHKYLEVIILTGHGSVNSAVDCTRIGAYGYLPKPYELDKLLDVLREAYEHRMRKKFEADQERLESLAKLATKTSALGILRAMRQLDDEEK